ncbi:AAA family ATPase [Kocuria coralli]|uniref:AAA family ATPase n=1 Tax=Kocuria coralli TaxID=1461025 RepID=A0A5J5KWF3_9MICC|nr:AAA family ATPase [Kocuria coralli]KAA9393225.1 AAA family ATPase [Kocuria coralli]
MPEFDLYPFTLDDHPAKADPILIAADIRHFTRIEASLERQLADLGARLGELRRTPTRGGQAAFDRDLEIHRLTERQRLLLRYGLDLCLGRVEGERGTLYIGRLSLTDDDGARLLVDWRAPAAEPFFAATRAHPMGLRGRRRYRWTDRRITDYWDEAFTDAAMTSTAALDEQSAFIASLGASRSTTMRDVLGTIQADQDAIIRADPRGALVVDGGPGTGKTVVALHRAAYLLYAEPRFRSGHGGILFVGPSRAYTAYVADILPGLGEEGVRTCTLADLVPEGAETSVEADRRVARLKGDGRMPGVVEAVVRSRERIPRRPVTIETAWGDVLLTPAHWEEAFGAAATDSTHNEAREEIGEALLAVLTDRLRARTIDREGDAAAWGEVRWDQDPWAGEGWGDAGGAGASPQRGFDDEAEFDAYDLEDDREGDESEAMRLGLIENSELQAAFDRAWPLLDPAALVRGLWTSPELLQQHAPWLTADEVHALQRPGDSPWTPEDLPLLDAAHLRAGDPGAAARRSRDRAEEASDRVRMGEVITDLIGTDDSEMRVMSMLRGQDLRGALAASTAAEVHRPGSLGGPFVHIVVDEAQELTDAQWHMLLRRNPSGSFTIVGDRAQARHGFAQSWEDRLGESGMRYVRRASLTINYRTPAEIMAEAAPVIRTVLPDANVPRSIRSSGVPVRRGRVAERDAIIAAWLAAHAEGTACVIGDPGLESAGRVQALEAAEAKGLEFDLVVLVEPGRDGSEWGTAGRTCTGWSSDGTEATVDRYVAMTRATRELVILT